MEQVATGTLAIALATNTFVAITSVPLDITSATVKDIRMAITMSFEFIVDRHDRAAS